MLMPTAGARLYIAQLGDGIVSDASLAALSWIEVSETEALGTLGGKWELVETAPSDQLQKGYLKWLRDPTFMQIVLGNDPADSGQVVLLEAYRNPEDQYAFRIDFPLMAGQSTPARRIWGALVIAFDEAFDVANGVIKTLVELIPQSEIICIEAT